MSGVFVAKLGFAVLGLFLGCYFCLTRAYRGIVLRRLRVAEETVVGLKALLLGIYALLWFILISGLICWYIYALVISA